MIFADRGVRPEFSVGPVGDMGRIPEDVDAVMVIGDAALTQSWEQRFSFCFDLGRIWREMTGLPFVFAVWVVRKAFARDYPDQVKKAHQLLLASKDEGYAHLETIVDQGQKKLGLGHDLIRRYYDLLICDLDPLKVKGMTRFFDGLFRQGHPAGTCLHPVF